MEAQIDMKVKVLVLLLALMALAVTASAQQDPLDAGAADSLVLNFAHVPDFDAATPDSTLVLEVIVVNDMALSGMSPAFKWSPAEMDLLSAAFTAEGTAAFDLTRLPYYRNRLDSSNSAQKFQCTGLRISAELSPGRTVIATYNFKLTSRVDSVVFDSSSFNRLAFVTSAGSVEFAPRFNRPIVLQIPQAVEIGDNGNLPTNYSLAQNYPNPFNPETNFDFALPRASNVELTIFNVLGQKVVTLIDQKMDAGTYRETWNGTSESGAPVASGIYFYRLTAGDFVTTKKMMMLK